jgi:ribosome-binding ATPase YchF (GTP1/OBG family)
MFNTIRFSLKKSKLLAKIRNTQLKENEYDFESIYKEAMEDAIKGNLMSEKEIYIEELLNLLLKDKATIYLLNKYDLNLEDLKHIISVLEQYGASQIRHGHYVAVSAIAFIDTLRILCNYWNKDGFNIEGKSREASNNAMVKQMLNSF